MEKGGLSAQGFTLFIQERLREENLIAMNFKNSYTVGKYTDIVGGSSEMCGKVHDGDVLIAETPPGCWGPMITPHLKSGHEVTCPVEVGEQSPATLSLCSWNALKSFPTMQPRNGQKKNRKLR